MRICSFFLILLLPFYIMAAPVQPDLKIADSDLEGFKKGCLLGAEKDVPSDASAQYCECFKSGMAKTVNRDEYQKYTTRIAKSSEVSGAKLLDGDFKKVEEKITGLVAECSALVLPLSDKQIKK